MKVGLLSLRVLLSSSATDIVFVTLPSTAVETVTAQCTSRWAMARGHRLNTSTVLAAVHGFSGLFRAVSAVEPSRFRSPPPPPPVPDKPSRFCGRKAKCTHTHSACPPLIRTQCNIYQRRQLWDCIGSEFRHTPSTPPPPPHTHTHVRARAHAHKIHLNQSLTSSM